MFETLCAEAQLLFHDKMTAARYASSEPTCIEYIFVAFESVITFCCVELSDLDERKQSIANLMPMAINCTTGKLVQKKRGRVLSMITLVIILPSTISRKMKIL